MRVERREAACAGMAPRGPGAVVGAPGGPRAGPGAWAGLRAQLRHGVGAGPRPASGRPRRRFGAPESGPIRRGRGRARRDRSGHAAAEGGTARGPGRGRPRDTAARASGVADRTTGGGQRLPVEPLCCRAPRARTLAAAGWLRRAAMAGAGCSGVAHDRTSTVAAVLAGAARLAERQRRTRYGVVLVAFAAERRVRRWAATAGPARGGQRAVAGLRAAARGRRHHRPCRRSRLCAPHGRSTAGACRGPRPRWHLECRGGPGFP